MSWSFFASHRFPSRTYVDLNNIDPAPPRYPTMIRSLRSLPLYLALAVLLAAVPFSATAQDPVTVIRNGRVLDGSGNPWMSADVVIQGERIVRVGDASDVRAVVFTANGKMFCGGGDLVERFQRA